MKPISKELERKIKTQGQGDRTVQYQSLGNLKGRRDMEHRASVMQLPNDFEGKSVLDIGCNLGAVCIHAASKNAGRVVGIDIHQKTIDIATEYAKHMELNNIEYYVANIDDGLENLKSKIGDEKFDYIFVLSVMNNVDRKSLIQIIKYFCKDTLYLEGHSKQKKGGLSEFISQTLDMTDVKFLGYTRDKYTRATFRAKVKPNKQ